MKTSSFLAITAAVNQHTFTVARKHGHLHHTWFSYAACWPFNICNIIRHTIGDKRLSAHHPPPVLASIRALLACHINYVIHWQPSRRGGGDGRREMRVGRRREKEGRRRRGSTISEVTSIDVTSPACLQPKLAVTNHLLQHPSRSDAGHVTWRARM